MSRLVLITQQIGLVGAEFDFGCGNLDHAQNAAQGAIAITDPTVEAVGTFGSDQPTVFDPHQRFDLRCQPGADGHLVQRPANNHILQRQHERISLSLSFSGDRP